VCFQSISAIYLKLKYYCDNVDIILIRCILVFQEQEQVGYVRCSIWTYVRRRGKHVPLSFQGICLLSIFIHIYIYKILYYSIPYLSI